MNLTCNGLDPFSWLSSSSRHVRMIDQTPGLRVDFEAVLELRSG